MAKYTAYNIASWLIRRNDQAKEFEDGDNLSLLKLIKLLYYAEGCSLGSGNGSLFDDPIVAWEHGPMVKCVWDKYRNSPDKYNITCGDDDYTLASVVDEMDSEVLEGVYHTFGGYSAWGLRNKTHEEDPWRVTTNNGEILNGEISRELIAKYFRENYVA